MVFRVCFALRCGQQPSIVYVVLHYVHNVNQALLQQTDCVFACVKLNVVAYTNFGMCALSKVLYHKFLNRSTDSRGAG